MVKPIDLLSQSMTGATRQNPVEIWFFFICFFFLLATDLYFFVFFSWLPFQNLLYKY